MRNASLDGVRGFAVLMVLLCHHNLLKSGWMGVDIFFVLSGYLITNILRRTSSDLYFWREYWIKRATRILPPFLLLLLITPLLGFSVSLRQAVVYLLSGGDVLAYLRPDFEALRALWSLAVEEHFYFLWPFAVRYLSWRSLLAINCLLILFELLLRAAASSFTHDWQVVYFLTPFRLDGLAFGCLLALLMESQQGKQRLERWSSISFFASCALMGGLRLGFGHKFTRAQPTAAYNALIYFVVPLIAVSAIAYLITHRNSLAARLLSWKPLVFTGAISYGLYLYQVLIREVLTRRTGLNVHQVFPLDTPIIFLVAWLSYQFYERPIVAWGRRTAERYRATEGEPKRAEVSAA